MALTLGQLTSSAGAVSAGMRQAEEAERQARQDQLAIEAQNRLAAEQARLREQRQAGLQVANVPQFAGMSGGQSTQIPGVRTQPTAQPETGQVATAYPVAPPAPVKGQPLPPLSAMDMEGGVAQGIYPEGSDTSTMAGRAQVVFDPTPSPETPLGRARIAGQQTGAEYQQREQLRNQIIQQYGTRAGLGGFFQAQTDEERQFAKDIMSRLDSMTAPEMQEVLRTGKLPPKTAPKAGVQTPTAKPTAGKLPAASVDAQVFANAAMAKNLPTDNATLNQIVGLVNQGRTPEQAADIVARSRSYDNAQTPYDDLIAQSARQYGIDPTIFKRLIGTESSFDPNAVATGANGKQHIGIAQISDMHGMSEADRRNPNVAIPFAAQLFSKYLQDAGGDYNEAILKYKGASSKKGRAAMQTPADIILAGTGVELLGKNPGQTADRVAQATSAAPAQAGIMYGPSSVSGMQNPAIQSALMARQILVERADMFYRLGMDDQALEAVSQIGGIDLGLYKAQADIGVAELMSSGDASRAMSVYSQFTGTPTQVLRRNDGTYDIYRNGQVSQTGVPIKALADLIQTTVDAGYRQRKAEQIAKMAELEAEAATKFGVENIKGSYALKEKAMELKKQQRLSLGNGQVLVAEPDGNMYLIDATQIQQEESPQGVMMPPTVQKIPVR